MIYTRPLVLNKRALVCLVDKEMWLISVLCVSEGPWLFIYCSQFKWEMTIDKIMVQRVMLRCTMERPNFCLAQGSGKIFPISRVPLQKWLRRTLSTVYIPMTCTNRVGGVERMNTHSWQKCARSNILALTEGGWLISKRAIQKLI